MVLIGARTASEHAVLASIEGHREQAGELLEHLVRIGSVNVGFPAVDVDTIPSVVFGPGDVRIARGKDEYIELSEIEAAARSLALACLEWCGCRS